MKRIIKKRKSIVKGAPKVTKGAPSGLVISLIVHAVAFFVAGLFVVFTILPEKESVFEAPTPVARPKMKLKKPKVKIKKSSQPKPSSRIVAKVKTAKMPEIRIPDLFGTGEGLLGGLGGAGDDFMDMPDVHSGNLFGSVITTGSDLVGTFYDFKRGKSGRNIPMSNDQMKAVLRKFNISGWDRSELDRYYQSPQKLYSTCIAVPFIMSLFGPANFNEDTPGYQWLVLYKGMLVHKDALTFRFWGQGDDLMIVRVNGEIVLNGSWPGGEIRGITGEWGSRSGQSDTYFLGNEKAVVGDWITLEPCVPQEIEVMIGEIPGGSFSAVLLCEVEGVDYPLNNQGGPILPLFRTQPLSHAQVDSISELLVEGEANVTNGPVFCDYEVPVKKYGLLSAQPESEPEVVEDPMRLWTYSTGSVLQAKYDDLVFDNVMVVDESGKRVEIPVDQLSAEDRRYIELMNPPEFSIDIVKLEDQKQGRYKLSPGETQWNWIPPTVIDYTFGAKVKQLGRGEYKHELTIEYYALGQQLADDQTYLLLARGSDSFVPSKENNRSHRFTGNPVETLPMGYAPLLRGRDHKKGHDYAHYIVLLIDERQQIIGCRSSSKWVEKHVNRLRQLPVGAFMNKECMRVIPTGPPQMMY